MATKFRSSVTVNCWKRHECVACGGAYRYKFTRTVTGTANSERAAEAEAEKAAEAALKKEVDERPCPRCGCLQPDMIGQQKGGRHLLLALAVLVASAVPLVLGMIPSATAVTYSTAGLVAGVASLLGLALHALIALANPNRNKEANRRRAEEAVEKGEVEAVAAPDADLADGEPKAVSRAAVPLLAAMAVGALLAFAPAALKLVGHWPVAAGTKPEVVGPGDTVTVWFPDRIDAVKGYWSGSPRATAVIDGRPLPVTAKASTASWGNTITGKSVSNSTPNLWAEVTLPADPSLAGKTVEVTVDMPVSYPSGRNGSFDNLSTEVHGTRQYTLAAPGAATTYIGSFLAGLGGALLFTVCGFGLAAAANGLRKFANPATVEPAERPRRRDDVDRDDDDRDDRRSRRNDRDDRDDDRPRRARPVRDDRDDRDDDRRRRRRDDDEDDDRRRPRRDRDDD